MQITFQSAIKGSGTYRADIDGLRAVAVLSVVFFHASVLRCQGGFVGVDVFFVISGYLITSLILKDLETEKFSLASFYERRMRRIFPALFAILCFCMLAAFIVFIPRDLYDFGKSLIATTFFASNAYFWRTAHPLGYFDASVSSQILLHTWSLSVEEQYYLLFPTFLVVLFRWAKAHIAHWLSLIAAISFLLNIWAVHHKPVADFYLFPPRAWELLIGAILASCSLPEIRHRAARETLGIVGLFLILIATFVLTASTPFPGAAALLPCTGAVLIIYAGEHGNTVIKSSLSLRPIVFIGLISYSLYLWHWPLLVITRYFTAGELSPWETGLVLLCSVAMAFLSFEFVEKPFRGAKSRLNRRQVFAFGLMSSVTCVALGGLIYIARGLPGRYDRHTVELFADNTARNGDYLDPCGNWEVDIHTISDIKFCEFGSGRPRKIMFWGDSHVGQLYPMIRQMYQEGKFKNEGVLMAIADGCSPAQDLNTTGVHHCDSFSRLAMMRAMENDIETVFIGFNTNWSYHSQVRCKVVNGGCAELLSSAETERIFLDDLSDNIRQLRDSGKRVIICLPFPMYDKSIPELEMRKAAFGRLGLNWTPKDLTSPALTAQIRSIAVRYGADVFDPRRTLCPEHTCKVEVNGVSIYKDSNHLAASTVYILEGNLIQVLSEDGKASM